MKKILAVLFISVACIAFAATFSWAGSDHAHGDHGDHSGNALSHLNATLGAVEEAAGHAKQGHGDQTASYARKAIEHAKQAIDTMPTGDAHAREATGLLKEAISNLDKAVASADGGDVKKARSGINSALDFTDAAIMHLQHSH